jgi:hypothetical protein
MHFEYTDKVKALQKRLLAFMDEYIYPNEKVFYQQIEEGDRWQPTAIIEELKPRAREAGCGSLLPEPLRRGHLISVNAHGRTMGRRYPLRSSTLRAHTGNRKCLLATQAARSGG